MEDQHLHEHAQRIWHDWLEFHPESYARIEKEFKNKIQRRLQYNAREDPEYESTVEVLIHKAKIEVLQDIAKKYPEEIGDFEEDHLCDSRSLAFCIAYIADATFEGVAWSLGED